jgi:hypothetical protein
MINYKTKVLDIDVDCDLVKDMMSACLVLKCASSICRIFEKKEHLKFSLRRPRKASLEKPYQKSTFSTSGQHFYLPKMEIDFLSKLELQED